MYKICLNALTVTCGLIKCLQLRTQLSGGRGGLIFSVCRRAVSTCKVLADVREILWSLQRFLLPKKKNQVDRKGAERSFASLCLCGTSRNKPATQVRGQCAKWVARSKNTKKPSSSVVWARAGGWGGHGLWFTLKLRRRNEKLLFTFQTDCSLYFHPRPNKSKGEELWKMRLWSGRGNVNQSSDPTLIYKSKLQVRQSRVLQHGVYTV